MDIGGGCVGSLSLALPCAGAVAAGSCNLCQAGAYQTGSGQPVSVTGGILQSASTFANAHYSCVQLHFAFNWSAPIGSPVKAMALFRGCALHPVHFWDILDRIRSKGSEQTRGRDSCNSGDPNQHHTYYNRGILLTFKPRFYRLWKFRLLLNIIFISLSQG